MENDSMEATWPHRGRSLDTQDRSTIPRRERVRFDRRGGRTPVRQGTQGAG
jgi:hypothetical protein